MPHIEDWFKYGDGLAGKITDHPHQDAFKSDCQWTSPIVEINEQEKWAVTTSGTRYTLGKRNSNLAEKIE